MFYIKVMVKSKIKKIKVVYPLVEWSIFSLGLLRVKTFFLFYRLTHKHNYSPDQYVISDVFFHQMWTNNTYFWFLRNYVL